jgi:hypothetical protein
LGWLITANSEKIDFELKINDDIFVPGENLNVSLKTPILDPNSNYTLFLYAPNDPDNYYHENMQQYPNDDFIYSIPPNLEGNWTLYYCWNNDTDAGVESQTFIVSGTGIIAPGGGGGDGGGGTTVVEGLDPLLVLIVAIIIIAAVVAGLASYQVVKIRKIKQEQFYEKLRNKFSDILSLNYLMVTDKKAGLNLYEQFFAGKAIDATLISGFLEAIRNFGIELTGTYRQSQTVKLEFQESKILMSEFKDFRIIIVMSDVPSEDFVDSIGDLSIDIENTYGDSIRKFRGGDISQFLGIRDLIEKNLNISFIYPLKIAETEGLELTSMETAMVNKAQSIMRQNNLDHFFATFLMPDQQYDPKKTETIFNLISKKVFVPVKLNFSKNSKS